MESGGKPGMINVSERTKILIETQYKDHYDFEFNKEIFISNIKENLKSFFVHKKKTT